MEPEVKDRKTKITKTIICSYRRKIERLYAERLRIYNLYNYENQLKLEGYSLIAGIDGRQGFIVRASSGCRSNFALPIVYSLY